MIKCLQCDEPGVVQWTLSSPELTGEVALCSAHSLALEDMVGRAQRTQPTLRMIQNRGMVRRKVLTPLNWTPPRA